MFEPDMTEKIGTKEERNMAMIRLCKMVTG